MKRFWNTHKKLHIWLLVDVLVLAAFFLFRHQRAWMNAINDHVTGPLRQALGRLCYRVEFSVMEVSVVLAIVLGAAYVIWSIAAVVRAKDRRGARAYSAVLGAACTGLSIYAVFCLLWGVNFWTDSFQEKSGIYAQGVAPEELLQVTVYFAQQLAESADDVPRDENGVFAVSHADILAAAPHVYDRVEEMFPFMAFDDPGVKPMFFSRLFSRMDFTGFYCSYTGESNVNVDSPACTLPATVCHELGHQRGIASEQECNFLAVLAATTSGDPVYAYSGWLKGYLHLSNALYPLSPDVYWAIRDLLPETVQADLSAHAAYWNQFRNTTIQKVSTTAYDGMLKAYGDPRGIRSYGTVVDMLVSYYK